LRAGTGVFHGYDYQSSIDVDQCSGIAVRRGMSMRAESGTELLVADIKEDAHGAYLDLCDLGRGKNYLVPPEASGRVDASRVSYRGPGRNARPNTLPDSSPLSTVLRRLAGPRPGARARPVAFMAGRQARSAERRSLQFPQHAAP